MYKNIRKISIKLNNSKKILQNNIINKCNNEKIRKRREVRMKKLHLGKRVVSFLMVIAMVFTMLPSIITYSVSAAETQSMTIHWQRPSNWTGWETPAIWFQGDDATASNYVTSGQIAGWGENDIGYTMTKESDGW